MSRGDCPGFFVCASRKIICTNANFFVDTMPEFAKVVSTGKETEMALLKLNGQTHFVDVNSIEVKKISEGKFEVTYDENRTFEVIGGRGAGGGRNDWFVKHELFYGDKWLKANSMIAAIKLGAQY